MSWMPTVCSTLWTTISLKKSALEVPIIEEFMRRAMCQPQWYPHNQNAADAMTLFKGAHSEPLLADRATIVKQGVPRHKVSTVRAGTDRTFFVHTSPGMKRSLCGVLEGGAMWNIVFVTPSFALALCVIRGTLRLEVSSELFSLTR